MSMNWLDEAEIDELNEALATPTSVEVATRFQINDLSSLNWTLRKLKAVEKSYNEDKALWDEEMARLTSWFNKQAEGHNSTTEFLEGLIREYANRQRTEDSKWKGSKTPYGSIGFRKQSKWDYGDEEALVSYLEKDYGFLVKVEKTPMKAEIKKDFACVDGKAVNKLTGEIIPGVTINELDPAVTIKLGV